MLCPFVVNESVEKWGAKNFGAMIPPTIFRPSFFDSSYSLSLEPLVKPLGTLQLFGVSGYTHLGGEQVRSSASRSSAHFVDRSTHEFDVSTQKIS